MSFMYIHCCNKSQNGVSYMRHQRGTQIQVYLTILLMCFLLNIAFVFDMALL
jgi:hypothetical protein